MATEAETGWRAWLDQIADHWTDAFQTMWDDAVTAFADGIEALTPDAATKLGSDFYAILWGAGGLFDLRDALTAREAEAVVAGVDVEAVRARVVADLQAAGDTDANTSTVMAAWAEGRCRFLAMGFMKGAEPTTPKVGIIAILVGGLVLSIGALCWCKVRMMEAVNEQRRYHWMERGLTAEIQASKDGRTLNWQGIAQAAPAPASGGDLSWLGGGGGSSMLPILGGVAAIGLLIALVKR